MVAYGGTTLLMLLVLRVVLDWDNTDGANNTGVIAGALMYNYCKELDTSCKIDGNISCDKPVMVVKSGKVIIELLVEIVNDMIRWMIMELGNTTGGSISGSTMKLYSILTDGEKNCIVITSTSSR